MKYRVFSFIMVLLFAFTVNAEGEATINNIKVNGTSCTCTGYDCVVDVMASSGTITYDLVDKNAKVDRLSGFKVDLLSEVTTLKLTVTNSTGDEKIENVYNLTINKQEKENDLSLKSLKVNGEDMKVAKDVVAYSYICPYNTKTITIEAVPTDSSAKVVKKDSYEFPIEDSSLSVDFSVKPTSGEALDYRVVVTRNVKPDTNLKSLKINGKEITLDEKEYNYELTVDYSVNEPDIEAVPSNKNAKVTVDSKTFIVGENEVKVTVTSEKAKSVYVVKVTREDNIDKSVANLKELKVSEYNKLDFEENIIDYTLKFNEVPEKLTITAKAKDENGVVEILGNEKLTDGSKVIVKVTLDKIVREYTLLVKQSACISDNKSVILGCIIGLVITIIVLIILDVHSKKKEKKEYLKKIIDLRHKVERKRKEEKEKIKKKLKIKTKTKEKVDEDGIEII
jgi:hypothetical protein